MVIEGTIIQSKETYDILGLSKFTI